jgi:Camelysin metallo-endopeptidase
MNEKRGLLTDRFNFACPRIGARPATSKRNVSMNRSRKLLLSLVVLGGVGAAAGIGTFSAFSSTTANAGNTFSAGTVTLADNDAGGTLYNVSNQKPGDSVASCIRVNYTGSLDATVKLYTASAIGAIGPYVNLTIESGTQGSPSFPTCTGFSAETTLFNNTLANFAATHTGFANGLADNPGTVATKWVNTDAVVYRITATLANNDLAQGTTSNAHTFTWEAQNQ